MELLAVVEALEKKTSQERLSWLTNWLQEHQIEFKTQIYASGTNLWVASDKALHIGVGSHFDIVPNSGGANDNGSAIAVCLGLLEKYRNHKTQKIGLSVYFFDEEETGLKGSKAFLQRVGVGGMLGLINLELVGMGNQFALWDLNENSQGRILQTFENQAFANHIPCHRFDKVITNTADHVSFRAAGVKDSFTVTCISEADIRQAALFYEAQNRQADWLEIQNILFQAPLFRHYHQPTDLSIYLKEESLQMTVQTIWQSILRLDKEMS
jgi:hypothetical protein